MGNQGISFDEERGEFVLRDLAGNTTHYSVRAMQQIVREANAILLGLADAPPATNRGSKRPIEHHRRRH